MHRRFPALLAALVAAVLVVPGVVLAARVTVRVEGKTQTIFAPTPRAVDAENALDALARASLAGEFFYHVTTASFGRYVDQIGLYPASGTAGWVFKVNGVSPPVGADAVQLKDGDTVLWYWAQFGIVPGGPPTLHLTRLRGNRSCYRAVARSDAGQPVTALGVTLRVDGRSYAMQGATGGAVRCLKRHTGLVRAVAPGMVRSNAVR
jgi:hypothetical protein